ncbi:MAG: exo-alpha-sialidase, partial [Vicinamibacteria bacterium]|nr:exo-alpha-sialidase [Vicinamibacteria bacterium]
MHAVSRVRWSVGGALAFLVTSSCGGGATPGPSAAPQSAATTNAGTRVSAIEATFDSNCGRNESGTVFIGAEVEPHLALNPARPANLIATWQQDRWSNGGARGLVTAVSQDGGATWTRRALPFSRCAGGPFERASDPWVTIGPTGIAQMMSLSITGSVFGAGSLNAMQVARSADGGMTWSAPITLIQDTAPFFNDKNSMTADPFDANFIYAAWDRLQDNAGGPAYFARSTDTGITWEGARAIHDPGKTSQTIGAEVVITAEGDVLYFFTQIDAVGGPNQSSVVFLRSTDRGQTWGPPVTISRSLTVGTRDPDTGAQVRDGSVLMHAAAGP